MEQFKYGNVEQTSRKARLKAEAVRLAMENMPKYVIRVDLSETHGVNLVGEPTPSTPGTIGSVKLPHEYHGFRATPEDMQIPHSSLSYE